MANFEPIIKTDLSNLPSVIETNIDELAPIINERIQFAETLVIDTDSEEDLVKCDADAALLAKMGKRISRFRLDWAAEWNKPFESVIAKCKDYEKRLAEAAACLRSKSEVGKAKVRDAKKARVWHMWTEAIKDCGFTDMHPWFTEFFEKMTAESTKGNWLLKGSQISVIADDMYAELKRCNDAIRVCDACYAADADALTIARAEIVKHFDVNDAVTAVNNYNETRARLAAVKAAEPAPEPVKVTQPELAPAPAAAEPKVETYNLAVTGTRAALVALRKWGEANGIKFKNLDRK